MWKMQRSRKRKKIIQAPNPNDNPCRNFGVAVLLRKEYFNKEAASL